MSTPAPQALKITWTIDALDLALSPSQLVRTSKPEKSPLPQTEAPVKPPKVQPVITWQPPDEIVYGTPLGEAQLRATVEPPEAGPVHFEPGAGTVLAAGPHVLLASTNETDQFLPAQASVNLTVRKAQPVITWATPEAIGYGTPLSEAQLKASVAPHDAGPLTYNPAATAVLGAGTRRLRVSTDETANYLAAEASVDLVVNKVLPTLTWATPVAITYGTPLDGTQLNAELTPKAAGPLTYEPPANALLGAGPRTLRVSTQETANHLATQASVELVVNKAQPTITWDTPEAISYGTPLDGTQLNAELTPSGAGPLTYVPAATTVLDAGTRKLAASTQETDNYLAAQASVDLVVNKVQPVITWVQPDPIEYGTPLSETQLRATVAPVPAGPVSFDPTLGKLLKVGPQTLKASTAESTNYLPAQADITLTVNEEAELKELRELFGTDSGAHDKLYEVVEEFEGNPAQLKQTMKALGGAKRLEALVTGAKLKGPAIKKLCEDLGAGVVGALMGSGNDPGPVIALSTELGSDPQPLKQLTAEAGFQGKPEAVAALLSRGCKGDAKTFVEFCKAFGSTDERQALAALVGGGADQAALGDHPEVLAELFATGCHGSTDELKKLTAKFKTADAAKGLKQLVDKGGLATKDAKPDCLGQLLAHGMGNPVPDADGRADALLKLCKDLDEPACTQLAGVMKEGGLDQQPESFAYLVGMSCQGDGAKLKDFTGAFDTKDKREALARITSKGGLGTQRKLTGEVEVDPTCLAQMVNLGHTGGPLASMADKSASFATLCGKLDDTACGHLASTLKEGGLGKEPAVLGQLVGIGCQGDGDKLKALTTELASDVSKLAGLEKLLGDGGFGAKDRSNVATGTDTSCLAELFKTGCEGKPAALSKLVKDLTNTDRTHFKEAMTNGGLGSRPKVLANAYKLGCQDDPYDPASDKDPAMLQELLTTFGSTANAPKLKDLLDNGGLGDPAHPEWLGKVMRDGFTDRPPGVHKQHPAELLTLHTAFNGHMPKLKTMIDAMGTMPAHCGDNDEPGKALQNVHKSAGVGVGNLKAQFFDTLEARSLVPAPVMVPVGVPPTPSLNLTALVQNAASMEFDPVLPPDPDQLGTNLYDTDIGHVMVRHSRRAPSRQANGSNDTGFFPKTCTDADIRNIIAASINACNAGNVKVPSPPTTKAHPAHPPVRQDDLHIQNGRQYVNVVGMGYTGTVGFKRKPPNGPAGPVQVGQYYPTAGPNVVTLNSDDLNAIKTALGK